MALVVIGGNAAGLSAAARARRIDPRLPIVVLEKGPVISYGACGLPYLVEGRVHLPEQLIVYTPEYFRKERNIDVRTGARVVEIAHPRREIQLETGERIRYDHLVLSTGARCDTIGHRRRRAAPRLHPSHTGGCRTDAPVLAREAAGDGRDRRRRVHRRRSRGRPAPPWPPGQRLRTLRARPPARRPAVHRRRPQTARSSTASSCTSAPQSNPSTISPPIWS